MQAIFSLAGKIRGIRVRVCGTKNGKKVAGKIRPRGAQGSIQLNINSSLCFGKNSQYRLDHSLPTGLVFQPPWTYVDYRLGSLCFEFSVLQGLIH